MVAAAAWKHADTPGDRVQHLGIGSLIGAAATAVTVAASHGLSLHASRGARLLRNATIGTTASLTTATAAAYMLSRTAPAPPTSRHTPSRHTPEQSAANDALTGATPGDRRGGPTRDAHHGAERTHHRSPAQRRRAARIRARAHRRAERHQRYVVRKKKRAARRGTTIRRRHGVPGLPRRHQIALGVDSNVKDFNRLTRANHEIRMEFKQIGHGINGRKSPERQIAKSRREGYVMAYHLGTGTHKTGTLVSTRGIAKGARDQWLIEFSSQLNRSFRPTYVRPMAEMNGHWTPYSAFTKHGKRRKRNSTENYKDAFRRIALISHGGRVRDINHKLRAHGMPRLHTHRKWLPRSGEVSVIWNPQGAGSPNVRGNSPADYYPGDKYVDIVANDLYSTGHDRAYWSGMEPLYNFRRKPFMLAEWGSFGADDPAFHRHVFQWAKDHPRTMGLVYFEGSGRRKLHLDNKHHSLKVYRHRARKVDAH